VTPYYDHDGITIYHGDCREILPGLDPVDLVLTDPPYGIGEKWAGGAVEGWKDCKSGRGRLWSGGETWDENTIDRGLIEIVVNMAPDAIIWGGNYYSLPPSRCWLVWDKCQKFSGSEAELAWSNLALPVRVYRLSRVESHSRETKRHPTQKPIDLFKWCIGHAPDNAKTILDPFMGSGTTLRAAKDLGRKAIGIEIEEKYCEIAAKRLAQGVLF